MISSEAQVTVTVLHIGRNSVVNGSNSHALFYHLPTHLCRTCESLGLVTGALHYAYFLCIVERMLEDHDNLVDNLLMWARDSSNRLVFVERPDKFAVFQRPEVSFTVKSVWNDHL